MSNFFSQCYIVNLLNFQRKGWMIFLGEISLSQLQQAHTVLLDKEFSEPEIRMPQVPTSIQSPRAGRLLRSLLLEISGVSYPSFMYLV